MSGKARDATGRLRKAIDAGKGEREIARELGLTRHQVRKAMQGQLVLQGSGDNRAQLVHWEAQLDLKVPAVYRVYKVLQDLQDR